MRIFLGVVRSLGRAGKEVHAAPFHWPAPALKSKYITKVHHIRPYPDDPAGWPASVLEVLRKHSFDLVVACSDDRAILPFHFHRDQFGEYPIAVPGPEAVNVLFDKLQTRQLCTELSIPISAGAPLTPSDTAEELAARFGVPLVIKPRRSYWIEQFHSRGQVAVVASAAELEERLRALEDHSAYFVEAFFQGVGVGVSVLAHEGTILHAFQHRRLREGRGGSSSRVSEPVNEDLYAACEAICRRTNLTGVCMFEFRYESNSGKWVLLEANARFWGSLPLAISLGVDFPLFLYDLLVHNIQHAQVEYPSGIVGRNFALDGRNLLSGVRDLRPANLSSWIHDVSNFLTQPARWLTGKERSDSFAVDDLSPAVWECVTLAQALGKRIGRKRELGV
jgi:predicted ATP-grasp superfamily ATP-dependent carboligase